MNSGSHERIGIFLGGFLTSVFFVLPYLWMLLSSFKTGLLDPARMFLTPWTFENYLGDLGEPNFYLTIINSLIETIATTTIVVALTIPASYMLARLNFPGKGYLLYTLLAFMFFPGIAIIGPLYNLESLLGIYDTWYGLIVPYCALTIPWSIWVLTGYFKTLPKEIEEAATVDGCTWVQTLTKIIIPLSKFAIITAALIVFITCWNEFILGFNLTMGNESRPVTVGVTTFEGVYEMNMGQLTAAGIIASIIPTALAVTSYKLIIEGLTAGAVKR